MDSGDAALPDTPASMAPPAVSARDGTLLLPAMLAALGRDSGATYSLCQMLTLQETSALHATCIRWHRWVEALPAGFGLDAPPLVLKPAVVLRLVPGAWTSRRIRSLTLLSHDTDSQWTTSPEDEYAAMQHLPHACPQLCALRLQLPGWPEDAGPLFGCLEALTEQLQTFEMFLAYMGLDSPYQYAVPSPALHQLIQIFGRMRQLRVLKLTNDLPPDDEEPVDWTPLTMLPELHSLTLFVVFNAGSDFSEAALRTLAACRQLTSFTMVTAGYDWAALRAFLDARSSDAAPLQDIDLEHAEMYGTGWAIIKSAASLTRLNPCVLWPHEQLWAELPRALPQLRSLHITTVPPRTGCTVWLPAVTQCTQLTDLRVDRQQLSAVELQQLVDGLPLLSALDLHGCTLESVTPLSSARALTSLTIEDCSEQPCTASAESERSQSNAATDWRLLLPSLPALRRLVFIVSPYFGRTLCIDVDESAARRAALLARMPLLAAVNFIEQPLRLSPVRVATPAGM